MGNRPDIDPSLQKLERLSRLAHEGVGDSRSVDRGISLTVTGPAMETTSLTTEFLINRVGMVEKKAGVPIAYSYDHWVRYHRDNSSFISYFGSETVTFHAGMLQWTDMRTCEVLGEDATTENSLILDTYDPLAWARDSNGYIPADKLVSFDVHTLTEIKEVIGKMVSSGIFHTHVPYKATSGIHSMFIIPKDKVEYLEDPDGQFPYIKRNPEIYIKMINGEGNRYFFDVLGS